MTDAFERWKPEQLAPRHALPLGCVLSLLAEGDERAVVAQMLELLRSAVDAGEAVALEVVLHGGVLKLRQRVTTEGAAGMSGGDTSGLITDGAHAHLVALARGSGDDAMVGLRGPAGGAGGLKPSGPPQGRDLSATARRPTSEPAGPPQGRRYPGERLSVLYTLAPGTAWAVHLMPREPAVAFGVDALSALAGAALLMREVHRIVSPSTPILGQRVDAAVIRLGVRAAALSGRERQICARIAGGHSASSIAAELGIAASTVMTLRKRAYAKLGIHDRRDLRHLAA